MRFAYRFLVLVAILPGCLRNVDGYCNLDADCESADFCRLPAHRCTEGMRKSICTTNDDCKPAQLCLTPGTVSCVDALAAGVFSGAQALPPNPSIADGIVLFYLKPNNTDMVYSIVHKVQDPTAVRLQSGKQGEAGGTVFELKKESGALETIAGFPSDQLTELVNGNLSVNIASAAFTAGEVRAQLYSLMTGQTAGPTKFMAVLTPLQTRLVRSATASGLADVTIDEVNSTVSYTISHNIDIPNNALTGLHLHAGPFNTEGPHIADVLPTPMMSPASGALLRSEFSPMYPKQAPLWNLFIKGGAAYFNVHTTRFSDGEIRGQILPFRPGLPIGIAMPFNVKLPSPNDINVAEFFLSQDQTKLTWRLRHTYLNPTSAKIEKITGGAVVCDMSTGLNGSMGTCDVKAAGGANDLLLSDLMSSTGALAVAVRTQSNPTGERGTIIVPRLP